MPAPDEQYNEQIRQQARDELLPAVDAIARAWFKSNRTEMQLIEALLEYGNHTQGCSRRFYGHGQETCDCGWQELKARCREAKRKDSFNTEKPGERTDQSPVDGAAP